MTKDSKRDHVLLLGATGGSGQAWINVLLSQLTSNPTANLPFTTLYIRPNSISKLPSASLTSLKHFRIIQGNLNDDETLTSALQPLASEPTIGPVTTVISLLGAYISLTPIFTRDQSHPIGDAFRSTILPAVAAQPNRIRVLALSTPLAYQLTSETKSLPWKWWFYTWIPYLLAPQGNAEMREIAHAVLDAGKKYENVNATVFRVPHLTNEKMGFDKPAEVAAGILGSEFRSSMGLTRESLVGWLIDEIKAPKWADGGVPMLANV